jgi:hypothetical protein
VGVGAELWSTSPCGRRPRPSPEREGNGLVLGFQGDQDGIEFSLAVPTLTTQNVPVTKAFYCERLGFVVNGSRRVCSSVSGVAFVHFAKTELAPRSNREGWDGAKPADISFFVDDVEALHGEYVARDVEIHSPPKKQSYGIIDMDVIDVNGYVLRFSQAEHSS